MPEKHYYFQIAPKAPLFKLLAYRSAQKLNMGQRVRVPLGKKQVNGLVVAKEPNPLQYKNIRDILEIDDHSPALSGQRLEWLKWMSEYYHYPLGLIAELNFSHDKFLKPNKEDPESLSHSSFSSKMVKLTLEQKQCVESILKQPSFQVHLIHGVTGSGKTEVYKEIIAHNLARGLQVLVLLPEIFLSPQIFSRFSESFPHQIALLHSQIPKKQKRKLWNQLVSERKKLLLGTRSALFCPLPRLGCIIIDEEHDSSFKQEDKFRYHARDSAIVLAKELDIPIILGSATPDFSSYQKALEGSYKLYELKKRAFQQKLPKVSIVDLKKQSNKDRPFWLSEILFEKMKETLCSGRQVALFLNRRGQARAFFCRECGHIRKCLNCDISLTLHKHNFLLCHYCSYMERKPSHCPSCKGTDLLEKGIGTQKIQEVVEKYFPNYQTFRADRDSIGSSEEIEQFMEVVEKQQAHILIGTQMLAKGLNFPSIYLVGLILADMDFHFPDFRAGERSFQTVLQMAGRAGRTSFGEVILQTFNPSHFSIHFAKQHDYKGFFREEIKSRKSLSYPPFSRLCLLQIDSLKEKDGQLFTKELACQARELSFPKIKILGPSPAPLMRVKNRYRFQILIKGKSHPFLDSFLKAFLPKIPKRSFLQVKVDRDPQSML